MLNRFSFLRKLRSFCVQKYAGDPPADLKQPHCSSMTQSDLKYGCKSRAAPVGSEMTIAAGNWRQTESFHGFLSEKQSNLLLMTCSHIKSISEYRCDIPQLVVESNSCST